MSDDDIRALVERLNGLQVRLDMEERGLAAKIVRQAAAALTALMAERDEARAAFSQASKESAESILLVASASRRAAFSRAREIAEGQVIRAKRDNFSESWKQCAREIAAAIEAEMCSDERQHSVQPLAELEPEVQDDANGKPFRDEVDD